MSPVRSIEIFTFTLNKIINRNNNIRSLMLSMNVKFMTDTISHSYYTYIELCIQSKKAENQRILN